MNQQPVDGEVFRTWTILGGPGRNDAGEEGGAVWGRQTQSGQSARGPLASRTIASRLGFRARLRFLARVCGRFFFDPIHWRAICGARLRVSKSSIRPGVFLQWPAKTRRMTLKSGRSNAVGVYGSCCVGGFAEENFAITFLVRYAC